MPAGFVFARGSVQRVRGADGELTDLAENVYGVHHAGGGNPLVYLAEEQRENLLNQGDWSSVGVVRDASGVMETQTNGAHGLRRPSFPHVSGSTYWLTAFAKPAGRSWLHLGWTNAARYFDLHGCASGGGAGSGHEIVGFADGWCMARTRHVASGTGSTTLSAMLAIDDAMRSYPGNAACGVLLRGVQLEAAPFATGYIPQGGRAACRLSGTFAARTPIRLRVAGRTAAGIGADQRLCTLVGGSACAIELFRRRDDRKLILQCGMDRYDLDAVPDSTDFDIAVALPRAPEVDTIGTGDQYEEHWGGTVARIILE